MATFKIKFGDDLRRFQLGEPLNWASLQKEIFSRFGLDPTCSPIVKYVDPDGDLINLSSDHELREAVLCFVKQGQSIVKLELYVSHNHSSPSPTLPVPDASLFTSSMLQPYRPSYENTFVIPRSETPEAPEAPHQPEDNPSQTPEHNSEEPLQEVKEVKEEQEEQQEQEVKEEQQEQQEQEVKEEQQEQQEQEEQQELELELSVSSSETQKLELGCQAILQPDTTPVSNPPLSALKEVHPEVICDSCRSQIYGVRFKCGHCKDFDLCETCEKTNPTDHPSNHLFIKIPLPIPRVSNPTWYTGQTLLPRVVFAPQLPSVPLEEVKPAEVKPAEVKPAEVKPAEVKPAEVKVKPDSRFVEDVSYPDGTIVNPGSFFTKTWKMMNTGESKWPVGSRLQFVSGDPMSKVNSVVVPSVLPGQIHEISAHLSAPNQPGRYVSHWRLVTPDGEKFGHRIWCDISVVEPPKEADPEPEPETQPEPAPTASQGEPLPSIPDPVFSVAETPLVEVNDNRYEEEMKNLISMGFAERNKNLRLLRKHNGELPQVIEELLADREAGWSN